MSPPIAQQIITSVHCIMGRVPGVHSEFFAALGGGVGFFFCLERGGWGCTKEDMLAAGTSLLPV